MRMIATGPGRMKGHIVEFRLLGPVEAYAAGRRVDLGPRKQRFTLAVLALEANQIVPVNRLVELMWPESPPRTAVHAVRVCASRLRSVLVQAPAPGADPPSPAGGAVELAWQGGGYVLRVDPMSVDVHRFRALTAQARTADSDEERVALLDKALGLWAGPALAGIAPTEVCERLSQGVEESRLVAIDDRIDARLRLGQHRELIDELTGLVAANPVRERLVGQLMIALHRAGRAGEALQAYRQLQKQLARELGLDPGPELQRIELCILRGERGLELDTSPTSALVPAPVPTPEGGGGPARVPAQLPPAVAGFTGRVAHLDRLHALLAEQVDAAPAVLITAIGGTAGVGKTALAVHWAHRIADRFPDGQLYVNLRGFDPRGAMDPAEAVRGFLDAFGVPVPSIPAGMDAQVGLYRSVLAGKRVLVVLDNARDVEQVRPLLPGSPGCLVVITSRNELTPLVVTEGAHPLTLDLLTPAEAHDLLARRLGAARVAGEPAGARDLVTRCARLPLALAIAAARAAARPDVPLGRLADELHDAAGALDAFNGGDAATDVRAVFACSYRTLSTAAARLFRLLGLHPGPDIAAPAAASLAGLPLRRTRPLLAELVRAHLLTEHSPGRYAFHDLLRAYAGEHPHTTADQRSAALHRLLDHYLHTAHAAALLLAPYRDVIATTGPRRGVVPEEFAGVGVAQSWLRAEQAVLVTAVSQAAASGFDGHAWQLANTVTTFLDWAGHWHDNVAIQCTALDAARRLGDRDAEARSLRGLAIAEARFGRLTEAQARLEEALALFDRTGDRISQANTCLNLAWVLEQRGCTADALRHCERALRVYRAAGHRVGQARALNAVGWSHARLGDYERALGYCQQALPLLQETLDRTGEATTWDSLGYAHHQQGHPDRAFACYERALDLYREIGDRYNESTTLTSFGDAQHDAGDPAAARRLWLRALAILDDLAHPNAERVRNRLSRTPEVALLAPERSAGAAT